MENVKKSQVATGNSSISNSNNNNDNTNSSIINSNLVKIIRKETIIISFIVGFISSLFASFIYEKYFH